MYNKVRAGVLARMQDNQLFAVASFLVGPNTLSRDRTQQYAGKSAIFAPQELTPKSNGVLAEMGSPRSEGVVAAEWNFEELRELWESSDTPIRRALTSAEIGGALGEIYARIQRMPPMAHSQTLPIAEPKPVAALADAHLTLDDLTVIDTYESPPPSILNNGQEDSAATAIDRDESSGDENPEDLKGSRD